jgi:hypothetical protein
MQSIDMEAAMSSTQLTAVAPAGLELAPCEIDGTNGWTELDGRQNEGLEVSLLWSKSANRVKVAVADARQNEQFEFDVAGADALAAFHHPFAYAAGRGLGFGSVARDSLDLQPQS